MEAWVAALGIFAATQVGSLVWILASQRVEGRLLRADIENTQREVEKLGSVLVNMADMRGEINLINDRLLAQGKRLDAEIQRANYYRDRFFAMMNTDKMFPKYEGD